MLNDAIYLNPSFVSFLPAYSFSTNYLFYKEEPHGHNVNVSLQDGRSELFQAGMGLTLMEDRTDVHFGASKSVLSKFGIGVGGKIVFPKGESRSSIWDSTFSTTYVPFQWLQMAFILDNVVETEDSRQMGMFREYILASKFNIMGIVLAYLDPHWAPHAPNTFGYEAGLEFPILKDFFLRFGNFNHSNVPYLNLRGRGYSAGLGWIGPRISVDYSYSHVVEPVSVFAHNFGLTFYF